MTDATTAVLRLARAALVCAFFASPLTTAVASDDAAQDHPAVSRYPGATIEKHDFKEYEEAQLILSKPYFDSKTRTYTADKLLAVEGRVTYLHYEMPGSASALQVFRNYQSALKRSGFTELYACNRPCYDGNLSDLRDLLKARDLYLNGHADNQYLAAQRGDTYVSLAVNSFGSGGTTHAWLFVIEKEKLDDGKMAVTGESPIAKALDANGRVDLYGFYFDTGRAQLKSGSESTLRELAQVLKDNPALQIDVVGHTDDVGSPDANQNLSQARAQAVTAALAAQHGVEATRMTAIGRGTSQPVASNKNEDGRAKNRRVEIVVHPSANTAAHAGGSSAPAPAPSAAKSPATPAPVAQPQTPAPAPAKPAVTADDAKAAVDKLKSLKGLFGL